MRGQGLELNQVMFHGEPVIWKIGFPFSITQYEGNVFGPYKDTLGHGFLGNNPGFGLGSIPIDAQDCPRFLGEGVLLNDKKVCVESRDGPEPQLVIWARYNIFNYRFLQGYMLDSRGNMEPFVRLGGQLIDELGADSVDHFHHLYWRVDFDIGAAGNDTFQTFLRPDEEWAPYGPRDDLPRDCRLQVRDGVTGWCDIDAEAALVDHPALFTRWRVSDAVDLNGHNHSRSYEAILHSDGRVDGTFTTFDALALQYQGDSAELGFEVPSRPLGGDSHLLLAYQNASQTIDDPVAWFALHSFHDPRDEEVPTMSYHHLAFTIRPRDFMSANPGEDSYTNVRPLGLPSVLPPVTLPVQPPPVETPDCELPRIQCPL